MLSFSPHTLVTPSEDMADLPPDKRRLGSSTAPGGPRRNPHARTVIRPLDLPADVRLEPPHESLGDPRTRNLVSLLSL